MSEMLEENEEEEMSEMGDEVVCDIGEILVDAKADHDKIENAIKRILNMERLAIVDREAELPKLNPKEKICDCAHTREANFRCYNCGGKDAQQDVLNEGFVREVKDE